MRKAGLGRFRKAAAEVGRQCAGRMQVQCGLGRSRREDESEESWYGSPRRSRHRMEMGEPRRELLLVDEVERQIVHVKTTF